jgi:hypothetical protein
MTLAFGVQHRVGSLSSGSSIHGKVSDTAPGASCRPLPRAVSDTASSVSPFAAKAVSDTIEGCRLGEATGAVSDTYDGCRLGEATEAVSDTYEGCA